jgi:prolyl-tRNA synthetase
MKKETVAKAADKIYDELSAAGYEVLYDDRIDAQAGFKFNDADLIGIPIQVIVGERGLKENKVEIKLRKSGERFTVALEEISDKIEELLKD